MTFDPKPYGLIQFKNVYEELMLGTSCAMFTAASTNISDKDADGNSLTDVGLKKIEEEREVAKQANDPKVYNDLIAEKPLKPSEMFNMSGGNIFPIDMLKAQKFRILATGEHRKVVSFGEFDDNGFFNFNPKSVPYDSYPVEPKHDKNGCVCVENRPLRVRGHVPDFMYRISCDYIVTGKQIGRAHV